MHQLGFSVLRIDCRGFGRGTDALPSEATAGEDAAWDWLGHHHPGRPRYIDSPQSLRLIERTLRARGAASAR